MIDVVSATKEHVYLMCDSLRQKDRDEIFAAGCGERRAVYRSWRSSIWSKVAITDGSLAAMWGISGNILSGEGCPWFLTTPSVKKIHPVRLARIYSKEVDEMHELFHKLSNIVDSRYLEACRLLELSGFSNKGAVRMPSGVDFIVYEKVK